MLSPLEMLLVMSAGVFAGGINTVIGSGTLVTFPVLLALGYPPVVANVSNSLGLVPGSLSGAIGYRQELSGQRRRIMWLLPASALGGVIGAVLLIMLPAEAFDAIVPALVGLALVLVLIQPWLNGKLKHRPRHARGGMAVWLGMFFAGIYGGYFGAAQGVLMMGILGLLLNEHIQRRNALKNVLAAIVNLVSGLIFIVFTDVAWLVVGLLAIGSIIGGQLGARIGRRLSPAVLRTVIVVVGVIAIVQLLMR